MPRPLLLRVCSGCIPQKRSLTMTMILDCLDFAAFGVLASVACLGVSDAFSSAFSDLVTLDTLHQICNINVACVKVEKRGGYEPV